MRLQEKITEPCDLLDDNGLLTRPGYATTALWRYDRKKIKAGWHRIKEWDYYAILAPWTFTSSDGRFEMDFQPILDRQSQTNILFLKSIQHQVSGTFTGKVVLDDGTTLQVSNFLGFAEEVLNWW